MNREECDSDPHDDVSSPGIPEDRRDALNTADTQSLGETVELEAPNSDHTTFSKIMKNIEASVAVGNGWRNEAIYGDLVAIKGLGRLESSLFDDSVLRTLNDAMDKYRPSRVREAACDAMLATQDQWLGSPELHKLEQFDIFRQLHSVVTEFKSSNYQLSFLTMIETLSRDDDWHPYLRKAMDTSVTRCQNTPFAL